MTLGLRRFKATGNQKVRNATKVSAYGLNFDSKLELYMWELLTQNGFEFEFQKVFTLQEGFRFRGEWIRPITWKADFVLTDCVIDTKGMRQETFNIRLKMWKRIYKELGLELEVFLPSSKKACLELIDILKKKRDDKLSVL